MFTFAWILAIFVLHYFTGRDLLIEYPGLVYLTIIPVVVDLRNFVMSLIFRRKQS